MPIANMGNTGGPMDWFNELPKMSRCYAMAIVFTAACVSWKVPIVNYLLLDWNKAIFGLQIWRLATHVTIAGPLGFPLLFTVIWILTYGSKLERSVYSIRPEDYLFMLIFGTASLAVISLLLGPLLNLAFVTYTGGSLVMMMLYVWSKEFPEQDVTLYGIIKIKGFWLPFAFLGLMTVMGNPVFSESLGILVGHAWYFLTSLLPRGTGKQYLATPNWVKLLAQKLELTAPPAAAAPQRPGQPAFPTPGATAGFQAFRGPARRLNS